MAEPKTKILPFADEGMGSEDWWRGQTDWAADIRKDLLPGWRRHAKAYEDKLKQGLRVNIEFEKTEQKRHQLYYRNPSLKLRPSPRTTRDAALPDPMQPDAPPRDLKKAVAIFREVLSATIGPQGANMKPTMDELIFDVLCPSGIAFAKVGYERYTDGMVPMKTGQQIPDPEFVPPAPPPGAVLGIDYVDPEPPMIDEITEAANVVCEHYYFERVSPAQALIPAEFRGSDYSGKAQWLGYDFFLTDEQIKAKGWKVPAEKKGDESSDTTQDDRITELSKKGNRIGQRRCREIYYFAQQVDPTVPNPKKIRRIVFVDGGVVVHEDSKDQVWDNRGRLIGGIEKLPIKVLTLRYVSDNPYPPSDCAISKQVADELSEFRKGQARHRRKAVPRVAIDVEKIADDKIKRKVQAGQHYDDIPVSGNPNDVAAPIAQPQYPNDNWLTDQRLKGDADSLWALGPGSDPNQTAGTTATEVAANERASDNRLAGEREKVVSGFWLEVVETLGQLLQLYADREDYVEIVGEEGAKTIEAWDKETIRGKFIYEAVPDSSLAPDAQADREQALNWYNLTANSQQFDQHQNAKDLAEAFGKDADRIAPPPQPPPPAEPEPPEPVKVSVSMKLEDLAPGAPLQAIALKLLEGANVTIAASTEPEEPELTKRADVIDRDRQRMAQSDQTDQRAGGLVGVQ